MWTPSTEAAPVIWWKLVRPGTSLKIRAKSTRRLTSRACSVDTTRQERHEFWLSLSALLRGGRLSSLELYHRPAPPFLPPATCGLVGYFLNHPNMMHPA